MIVPLPARGKKKLQAYASSHGFKNTVLDHPAGIPMRFVDVERWFVDNNKLCCRVRSVLSEIAAGAQIMAGVHHPIAGDLPDAHLDLLCSRNTGCACWPPCCVSIVSNHALTGVDVADHGNPLPLRCLEQRTATACSVRDKAGPGSCEGDNQRTIKECHRALDPARRLVRQVTLFHLLTNVSTSTIAANVTSSPIKESVGHCFRSAIHLHLLRGTTSMRPA